MSDPYLTGVTWRLTNMSEADRRESEELMGRLAAGWSRGLRRMLRAMRLPRASARTVAVAERRP
jgi:hypothetical protein